MKRHYQITSKMTYYTLLSILCILFSSLQAQNSKKETTEQSQFEIPTDNNYPFSIGRHVGARLPDDNEFILLSLDQPLGRSWNRLKTEKENIKVYPNTFKEQVTFSNTTNNSKNVYLK